MPVTVAVLTPASGHFPVQACASPVLAGGLCGWRPQHRLVDSNVGTMLTPTIRLL
ncbi:hypothetical protein PR003_g5776 [Phytophthora rubi]|uniref:Uncharacterized protein n=1 Tax=Phytophthora rubi TaxID=129364 RepID=A0A6A3N1Y1_9STRA|nr:hypothetical protein PR002_g6179 [Phytophthora rubi]KAE9043565.1 hypothetical protein PR001_g5746 [Phytophthora rubi]KAE9349651.1 hypothetical protein PR003_g5776 [Phytophthora rubi]